MWCWGRNTQLELAAAPSNEQVRAPTQVGTFTDWTAAVDVGQDSSCGIRADGTLWCWGDNSFGQLGAPPETAAVAAPRQVGSQAGWVAISVDAFAACGVRSTAGSGAGGVTPRGNSAPATPTTGTRRPGRAGVGLVERLGRALPRMRAADRRRLACMGENSNGQLGLGDTARRNVPTPVPLPAL